MKRALLFSMLLVVIPSFLLLATEYKIKGKAGNYSMEVRFDKNQPGRGNNNISIYIIEDRTHQPVTDAHVEVRYFMPSFPGKEPMMEDNAPASLTGDHYLAKADLSMVGRWTVIISVNRAGKTGTMQFSFVVK
jgi:hypothetical protein